MAKRIKVQKAPGRPRKSRKKLLILLAAVFAAVMVFSAALYFPQVKAAAINVKYVLFKPRLGNIAIFTASQDADALYGTELYERLKKDFPKYKYIKYDFEQNAAEFNKYYIKSSPTVLFLTSEGYELARLETEKDYSAYTAQVNKLRSNPPDPIKDYGILPEPSADPATLYLLNKNTDKITAIKQFLDNQTSVKEPQISAINTLLNYLRWHLPDDLDNPIPEDVKLISISNQADTTVVTLTGSFQKITGTKKGEQGISIIANTLMELGSKKVQIKAGSYLSPVIANKSADVEAKNKYNPDFSEDWAGWTPSKNAAQYNIALLHLNDIRQLPCYCGCAEYGYKNLGDCFYRADTGGMLTLDKYAEYNDICKNALNSYIILKTQGESLQNIRDKFDQVSKKLQEP